MKESTSAGPQETAPLLVAAADASNYGLGKCVRDIREDLAFYANSPQKQLVALLLNPRTQLIVSHRITKWLANRRSPGRALALMAIKRWQLGTTGCDIAPEAEIGRRLRLPHPTGIVIGIGASLADDVTLYQHVTLGTTMKNGAPNGYPRLEEGVTLYTGAVAIGGITIGRGAVLGAMSLVEKNVEAGAVVPAFPARRRA